MNNNQDYKLNVNRGVAELTFGNIRMRVRYEKTATSEEVVGETSKFEQTLHNRYRVSITNKYTGIRCSFNFLDSHNNTINKDIFPKDLGYSILACVRMDWLYTKDDFPTFESFANEFGYDLGSRRDERIYREVIEHGEKLRKVIDKQLHEQLPE